MKQYSIVLTILLITGTSLAQDEEAEPLWSIAAGSRYMSRFTTYGLDLSNDRAALGYGLTLGYGSGLSIAAGAINTLGTGGELQQWSIGAGYEWQISELLTLSGEYTHFVYSSDSVNILASLTNSLSLSAELSFDVVDVEFSYDTFLGTNSASYFGVDVSGFHQIGGISIVPLAQVTFMSQSVESRLLKTVKTGIGKGGPPSTTTSTSASVKTVTGLSSFSLHIVAVYPIVGRLSAVFHPSYQYSPKAEVTTRTSQFIWSIGLRYSYDF